MDFLLLLFAAGFFLLTGALAAACEKLRSAT